MIYLNSNKSDFTWENYYNYLSEVIKKQSLDKSYDNESVDLFFNKIIASQKLSIDIDDENPLKVRTITAIKKLLSRKIGRRIFKQLMASPYSLQIFQGPKFHFHLSEKVICENNEVKVKYRAFALVTDNKPYCPLQNCHSKVLSKFLAKLPFYVALAHEIIHYNHYSSSTEDNSIDSEGLIHAKFDNIEEQHTMLGIKKIDSNWREHLDILCENALMQVFELHLIRANHHELCWLLPDEDISPADIAVMGAIGSLKALLREDITIFYHTHELHDLNYKDERGKNLTLLTAAILGNQKEMIDYLLELGANVSMEDDLGGAISVAALQGDIDLIQTLLDKGADINQKDTNGITPLIRALCGIMWRIESLQEKFTDRDLLNFFIDAGANIIDVDDQGCTIIFYMIHASRSFFLEEWKDLLDGLVDLGLDIHAKNFEGITTLMHAIHCRNVPFFNYLLNNGADLLAINNQSQSVVDFALISENTFFLQELQKKGIKLPTFNEAIYSGVSVESLKFLF